MPQVACPYSFTSTVSEVEFPALYNVASILESWSDVTGGILERVATGVIKVEVGAQYNPHILRYESRGLYAVLQTSRITGIFYAIEVVKFFAFLIADPSVHEHEFVR